MKWEGKFAIHKKTLIKSQIWYDTSNSKLVCHSIRSLSVIFEILVKYSLKN